jgi:hypothetical protein
MTLNITEPRQLGYNCNVLRCRNGSDCQDTDPLRTLLRGCSARPTGCHAAEKGYEVPALHGLPYAEDHVGRTEVTSHVRGRIARAVQRNGLLMSEKGQTRRFRAAPDESGPPPITDIRCQRLTLTGLDLTVRRYRALRFMCVPAAVCLMR